MNAKKILHEYCQKNGLDNPTYESWSVGRDNEMQWFSKTTMYLPNGKQITAQSKCSFTKKQFSEQNAAENLVMLMNEQFDITLTNTKSINSVKSNSTVCFNKPTSQPIESITSVEPMLPIEYTAFIQTSGSNTIYLIDLENVPLHNKKVTGQSLYLGFINCIHSTLSKYNDWFVSPNDDILSQSKISNKLLFIVEGGIPDVSDHFMTCMTYPVVTYIKSLDATVKHHIYIVSKDHAAYCTKACLRKILDWNNLTNVMIYNIGDI